MWETVLTITVIATLAMISPGPDFVLVVKNAARYSRRAALATTVGINLGIAVHMSYCILGLALIIAQTPWLFGLLEVCRRRVSDLDWRAGAVQPWRPGRRHRARWA